LIATSFASQGCLVPWSKYLKVKRRVDELEAELREKDSQLADDAVLIQTLRDQLTAKDQLIKLYEKEKEEAVALTRATKEELDALKNKLEKQMQDFAARHKDVSYENGGFNIKSSLLFEFASDKVSAEGMAVLKDLAAEFKGTGAIFQVDGHTDDVPVKRPESVKRFIDNWGLSANRACAVVRVLSENGMTGDRLYARAFSKFRPKAQGATEAARSQNRRVEIYLLPTGPAPAPGGTE
jgi:chemotaxis protein MotB